MIEKYRVSLEIAKQLKEAGFPQDCDAYWMSHKAEKANGIYDEHDSLLRSFDKKYWDRFAAPCVGRLGDELPIAVDSRNIGLEVMTLKISKQCVMGEDCFDIFYESYDKQRIMAHNDCNAYHSEADIRAMMYIELRKKGLLP